MQQALDEIGELRQAVALREAFIATIGHELRNPMVPILLCVERLRGLTNGSDPARLARSIEVLGHATDAFMRRAAQLLDISRLGNTGFVLQRLPCDISDIVHATALRHAEVARRAGCELRLEIEPGVTGAADHIAIEQLLDNLLSNAFKYGAGRPVGIILEQADGIATLCIVDRGQGIGADEQDLIFDLFKRARDPSVPGLGIGLWISARLAEAMGGGIAVQSSPNVETRFIVTLPLRETIS